MRPYIYIVEEKIEENTEEVKNLFKRAESSLFTYLQSFVPKEKGGFSKHATMGPIGKLIPLINSNRMQDANALIGFTLNIHRNASDVPPNVEALQNGIEALLELKKRVNIRRWFRITQELDYAIFKDKYEQIATRIKEKKAEKETNS